MANDAGLIAQTLQAAGFDVVGARDLDADTLRRSLRDFIQKAETSGPGTVAMVYLAGYGIQLAGENYFIPVDSSVSRDTDVPIEGLRISDYVRQLASLSLKASIVVLDAARQQPFIQGGQPIASGLALVEPDAHMLIAFNAAPGTVAPNEQGPYGIYAQSLAEMIRTGGLPLPEVFNRVRLRVNQASNGAQVPWDAQKIDALFTFFNRAPDAPTEAAPDQTARNRPIRDLSVQDAYAAALERDSLQGYEDYLATYPGDPLAKRVLAIVAARREAITWLRTYRNDTPQAYWSYLRRYPRGPHAGDARRRLAILTAQLEPPPSFAVIDYDVPPPPPEEIIYVDRPVLIFNDPEFDFAPPPPPPFFFLPPPPPDFIVLEPPFIPIGLFILPQPYFVPIPVYVVASVYVVPPPNNIIFVNILNTTVINNVINQPANIPPKGGATPPGAKGQGDATQTNAGPALPPAVAQKASLIQQGKLPVPASGSINPAAKAGAPGIASDQKAGPNKPTNVSPNALPQGPALPKANALPVPGTQGAPAVPPGALGTSVANPNSKLAPQNTTPPAGASPNLSGVSGSPKTSNSPAALVGKPKAGSSSQAAPDAKLVVPETARKPNVAPLPKPAAPLPRPVPQAAPRPDRQPRIERAVPRIQRVEPRIQRETRTQRIEPPGRSAPASQMARPAPRMAPSPPPRLAAPPPRMAPPPPPRMAAPPPPRMAPPPPPRPAPPAAARRCPPNVPKC